MVTNEETTVKVSKWLIKKVDVYLHSSLKNQTEFPSKRNFVDKAIIELLEKRGLSL
jgi:hypothetical protein